MNVMLIFALTNAVIATVLFVLIAACKSRIRNPAALHWLWLVVLLKFVTPPFLSPHWALLPAVVPSAVESPAIELTEPIVSRHTNPSTSSIPQSRHGFEVASTFNSAQDHVVVHAADAGGVTETNVTEISVQSNQPEQAATVRISPIMIIMAVGLSGTILFWGLSIWRIICLHRFLRFAQAAPLEIQQVMALLAEQLGLRYSPRILLVPGRVSPMLWAFIGQARIIVPNELFNQLDEPSRRTLLLHELVHYSRGDQWVRWLELIVLGLYWWHPIVWLLRREIRISEEMACDVRVVSESPSDRRAYAEMLVHTVAFLSSVEVPSLATGIGTGSHLEARLRMIMRSTFEVRLTRRIKVLICLVAILVLPLAPVLVRAQRDANSSPSTEKAAAATADSDVKVKAPEDNENQPKELVGTVVDEEDKPVAGIDVKAFLKGQPVDRALKTNELGQFRIPGSWHNDDSLDSNATLIVRRGDSHLGWISLRSLLQNDATKQKPLAPSNSFRVTLLPLSQIAQGTLVDPDGKPLNGVRVNVMWMTHPVNQGINYYDAGKAELPEATTDSKGSFQVRMPVGTLGGVEPQHLDWQSVSINMQPGSLELGRTTLARAARIQGRVVDAATGKPLANQKISAQSEQAGHLGYGSAKTDQEGQYVIGGLGPGKFNVLFSGDLGDDSELPKFTAVAVEGIDVLAGQPAQADFVASPGRLLRGTVLDSDAGKPLAKVSVGYYGPARPNSGAACLMVRTKADGTFEFRIPPGVSKIYVAEGDREPDSESTRVLEVPADKDLVDVILRAGQKQDRRGIFTETRVKPKPADAPATTAVTPQLYQLQVVLQTPSGGKINNVIGRVIQKRRHYPSQTIALSATGNKISFNRDEDGRTMFLLITADGFATARSKEFVIRERMPDLSIDLIPEVLVPVRGRVVDKNGSGVETARVRVGLAIYGNERKFPWGLEYTTDKAGRFEIKHARLGDQIQVRIDKPGTGGNETEWFSIDRAEPRILPDLVVGPPDQELGGLVRDHDGFPVANAKVIHRGEPGIETTTDSEGKFRLTGLPTGLVSLSIESEGFPREVRRARAGRLNNEILVKRESLQDDRDYRAKVKLRPRDGKDVSKVTLFFGVENGDPIFSMPDRTGNSHELGFGSDLRRYHDKQFAVVVAAEGYARTNPVIIRNQKALQEIAIDLEPASPVSVRGRVIDGDGRPVAGANVGLSILLNDQSAFEPWIYFNDRKPLSTTDADGRFSFAGVLRNSRAAVYVNKPSYAGVWSKRITTDKPEGVEWPELRLLRSTRELSGQVVDDKGQPVADAIINTTDISRTVTTSDAQGRFRILNAPLHEFWLEAEAESGDRTVKVAPDATELKIELKRRRED
jgi:beta-lactamase regulating signal transducer with metallopeptidase domain/uncharacterized GH25 family protein